MSTADLIVKVDGDQLELIAVAIDALAAAAGDRAASDRMGDFYETMGRERTEDEIVAKCRSVSDIVLAALDRKA
jgi:hypothetical protein